MEQNFSNWNNILSELIDFSNKMEFLQSKMRLTLISYRPFDSDKYIKSLKLIICKHEYNLSLIPFSGSIDINILPSIIAEHKIVVA